MSIKNRLIAVLCVLVFMATEVYIGFDDFTSLAERQEAKYAKKETLHVWYTDDALTDYINSVALNYYEDTDVRVVSKLVSGSEYLESLNEASLAGEEIPDLYIIENDSLGKAYLSGLADVIRDSDSIVNKSNFSQASMDAVSFDDKIIAYPFYCETSYLLYNKTYLHDIAFSIVEAEFSGESSDEDNAEGTDETVTEDTDLVTEDAEDVSLDSASQDGEDSSEAEETDTTIVYSQEFLDRVDEVMNDLLPDSIEDILNFADEYDAPENVESIFKWDVSDIFYNYFFIGNYVTVGGEAGDDSSNIDIYNESAIRCLETYQKLNQFFSIDADTVDYRSIIQEFMEGKMIFTVATTDAISTLEDAISAGDFTYEYGVMKMPDINADLKTRSFSTTNVVAVNGYSKHKDAANQLAQYLTYKNADTLYSRGSKIPARMGITYQYPALQIIMFEYALSTSLPKLLETSNYWVEMELAFTKAWLGEDVNQLLKNLSEEMKTQINGSPYTEEYILLPESEDILYEDGGME